MPFSKMSGGIARIFQGTGEHRSSRVEPLSHSPFIVVIMIAQIGSDFPALWILTGGYGYAGGRTDGRVHVKLVEAKSFFCKSVNIGSLCRFVSEAGKVAPAHVIDKYKDDVRALSESRIGKEYKEQEWKKIFHSSKVGLSRNSVQVSKSSLHYFYYDL